MNRTAKLGKRRIWVITFTIAWVTLILSACTTTLSAPASNQSGSNAGQAAGSTASSSESERIFEQARATLNNGEPSARTIEQPLVLAHYMPWFEAPPRTAGYGYHWHMGGAEFNPYEVDENGQANIATHYYPLTGPYDSADRDLIRYHLALMKLSGIDGVIFDWYGIREALDYGPIHEATQVMVEEIERAGMYFVICYEDQSLSHMVEGDFIDEDDAMVEVTQVMAFLEEEWFGLDSYVKFDGKPVLMVFGPQHFEAAGDWAEIFTTMDNPPHFAVLDSHQQADADSEYNWLPMEFSTNGTLTIPRLVDQLDGFYTRQRDRAHLIATAFPGFHDIYAEAGVGESYGFLDDYDGETFKLTLDAALMARPNMIQIATWNDFGEGTIVEPTVENGYRDLETLQDYRKDFDDAFIFSARDLRIPIELYKLWKDEEASEEAKQAAIDAVYALLDDDLVGFRQGVKASGVKYSDEVQPLLLGSAGESDSEEAVVFDSGELRNLALGASVSSSGHIFDFVPESAIDEKTSTYWEAAANDFPNQFDVDLGAEYSVDTIVIKLNPSRIWQPRIQNIEVQLSSDGQSFATVVPATDYTFHPTDNSNSIAIPVGAAARNVRLIITKNTEASGAQMAELEIFGN